MSIISKQQRLRIKQIPLERPRPCWNNNETGSCHTWREYGI